MKTTFTSEVIQIEAENALEEVYFREILKLKKMGDSAIFVQSDNSGKNYDVAPRPKSDELAMLMEGYGLMGDFLAKLEGLLSVGLTPEKKLETIQEQLKELEKQLKTLADKS